MDSSDKVKTEGVVKVKSLYTKEADHKFNLNPMSWNWHHIEKILQLNEPWTWLLIPCQGMTGQDILLLTAARVCELSKPFPGKLEEFFGFVNYLRVLHCGANME